MIDIIKDDSIAASFQSMGSYRKMLLEEALKREDKINDKLLEFMEGEQNPYGGIAIQCMYFARGVFNPLYIERDSRIEEAEAKLFLNELFKR